MYVYLRLPHPFGDADKTVDVVHLPFAVAQAEVDVFVDAVAEAQAGEWQVHRLFADEPVRQRGYAAVVSRVRCAATLRSAGRRNCW